MLLAFAVHRKRGLLLNNVTGIVGAALMAFSKAAQSYEMLIIGRLIIGFNCGASTYNLVWIRFAQHSSSL